MFQVEFQNKFKDGFSKSDTTVKEVLISEKLNEVFEEMSLEGYSNRTLRDYKYHFERMCKLSDIRHMLELDKSVLATYLKHNDVKASTQNIRLKNIRPILIRFEEKGLLVNFWSRVRVKVSEEIKVGITDNELNLLLSLLDFSKFTEFRDACVFLTMYETGFRIGTISSLTADMVDIDSRLIHVTGEIMKNNKRISLPISDTLSQMLAELMKGNEQVLKHNVKESDLIFLSSLGNPFIKKTNSNIFSKRVSVYRERFGLENINPHAIRRGFAKRLLDNGVNITTISKALTHNSIDTTTKYLYIDNQEIIDSLRDLL